MADSEYKISIQSGYVLVEDSSGYDVTWAEQPAKLQAISAACEEAGHKNVLIRGENVNVKLTVADIFNLGKQIAELRLRVAIVQSHNASIENARLLENAATTRGGPVQFFDNQSDAKAWLGVG